MTGPLFEGLPRPSRERVTVYLLGPGYGESQVVVLPDGACLVVDSCRQDGVNLARALLDWLNIRNIALLVVTHPDLDHIGGLPELVRGLEIETMWRFRGASRITDLAAYWLRGDPHDARLAELHEALTCMDELEERSDVWRVDCGSRSWRRDDCEVHCLAPTQRDQQRLERRIRRIIDEETRGFPLAASLRDYLLGDRRTLGESGNPLSLALVVCWGDVRLLLAGDVENGDGHPRSGWRGVLWRLERDGGAHVLSDLSAVKTAHHGSSGAFLEEAWKRHASARRVGISLVAPFDRGRSPPPHVDTLLALASYSELLAVTAVGAAGSGAGAKAREAGWVETPAEKVSAAAPCVAVALDDSGACAVSVGEPALLFRRR